MNNKETGNIGEDIAANYLTSIGFTILSRNYRTRLGELDIIALSKGDLSFIEVKTRRNLNYGYPREAVGALKQQKIKQIANYYILREKKLHYNIRFDVIEIYLDYNNVATSIELFENAFE